MAWGERKPIVGLTLDTTVFNVLVDILNYHSQLDLENNNFVETARRLKEKILTYSVPRTDKKQEKLMLMLDSFQMKLVELYINYWLQTDQKMI